MINAIGFDGEIDKLQNAVDFLKIGNYDIKAEKNSALSGYELKVEGKKATVVYGENCDLFCALTSVSQGKTSETVKRNFDKLGYMVDVARNAVPKISTLEKLVDYLAVLGYNRLYIYLEDLFEVENEPLFGYLRGRYSSEELKELDDYCYGYGIELIPCIQTLAHLNAIFKWDEYVTCLDTSDILLVGAERTYKLIRNMFETVSKTFRTKTLHVGMDEAHLVGRGSYLDKNGYKTGYEVMAEHIAKISETADEYGFKLMIWSDMYFRLAFGGAYYSETGTVSDDVIKSIPKNVSLVYWDYYNLNKKLVSHMMDEHAKSGNDVCFAGGAWKWAGWNPSTKFSLMTSEIALDACKKHGVDNVMLTAWADDGAEASLFSTLPTMIYYSESCYGEATEKSVDDVLKSVFGLSLKAFYAADMPLITKKQFKRNYYLWKLPKILFYNDPLSGVYDGVIKDYDIRSQASSYAVKLKKAKNDSPMEFKYIFENLENLCRVLELKSKLGVDIRAAYRSGDTTLLDTIAERVIPLLIRRIKVFEKGFYAQWMAENKDNGYQTHDLRIGGMVKRLETVRSLLRDYLDGKITEIYELKDDIVKIDGDDALSMLLWKDWRYIHSVYVV